MKKLSYALIGLGLLVSINSFANTAHTKPSFTNLDKIVAIVNREPITLSQLNKEIVRVKKQMEQTSQPIPPQTELKKQVLDNLIAKSLQLQLCQAKGIKVAREDVDQTVENIAKSNRLTVEQLKEAIENTGTQYDDYLSQIKEQLTLQKLQQEAVAKDISFSPEDVKKYMRENKDKFVKYSTFHLIDILLPTSEGAAPTQIAQVKNQANQLAKKLQTSQDINETLTQYPSASTNDLGWRQLVEIPSLFQRNVASLNVKGVSSPIQAPNGFHILQLVEAKGDSIRPTETQIKNIVFQQKMSEAVKVWIEKIRNDAYVKIIN